MRKRGYISLREKLAAALRVAAGIDYDHAKAMSADQVISLFQFDHGVLHANDGSDEHWNLTPRLIQPHREKSKEDNRTVKKGRRLSKAHAEHIAVMRRAMLTPEPKPPPRSRWPAGRKMQSRPFQRRITQ